MSTRPLSIAAIALLAAGLLTGWTLPAPTPASPRPVACESDPASVPADYLLYHALVSPHAALAAPRSDAPGCAAAPRRVRT